MITNLADIRKEYILQTLNETDVETDAIKQFGAWWQQAVNSGIDEVNAFVLATATPDGEPSARVVLLKGYNEQGFIFFTNYESNKGRAISSNPRVSMVFFWKEIERQVRIEGVAEKISNEESDHYFAVRPLGSQVGAWASPQSTVIESRAVIEENAARYQQHFEGQRIPRPPHWGGYLVKPMRLEFWQGRSSRLHDRLLYSRLDAENWEIKRLAP